MICELCQKDYTENLFHGHHLSYDPEIVVMLCIGCHAFLHRFANYTTENQTKIIEWTKQYSDQWNNCTKKYRKSQRAKDVHNAWCKEQRILNPSKYHTKDKKKNSKRLSYQLNWQKAWRKNNPEKAHEKDKKAHLKYRHGII